MAQEYKVKGLASLDLKSGEKREVELEGIENGKVLLARVGDKTHALSSNCTHYGAPMKLGVLTPDGRLTCAWHGACFNVASGDVEDAPALDPLAKFDIVEKNGGVYVKGDEKTIKASRRQSNTKCASQGQEKVVVVGGGSGAMGAVQALREQGFKGAVTMISSEPNVPIDRTKLSKALIADASKIALRTEDWFKSSSVEQISDEVSSVDFEKKSVSTTSGSSYPYTKLILASGGTPKALPLPGFKDLSNIFLLRTIPDVQAILSAVGEEKGKKIVVVGSSFIGMEVSNALASNNDVTVIGMESAPLERVMGAEVGKIFQSLISKNGVKFHMSASVDSAHPSSDKTRVGSVKLKDGTSLPADLVILGIGVAPATGYLKDNPAVKLQNDGSLLTSESFAVKGLDDVYAIGDIASYPYHGPGGSGAVTRIEHWNVAQNAGRSVARSIVSPSSPPKPFIPIFWSALGSQLRYCGNTPNGWDQLVLQGQPEEGKFAAFYGKEGVVVAVASMMMDPVMTQSAELMRRGRMPGVKELEGGLDVKDVQLPVEVKM
ncbi:Apoptosis-inducing factor 1 [Lecanora helva]